MSGFNDQIISEFRANGGRVETGGFGSSLVLLHTIGAKTGEERISPVMAIAPDAASWLIVASAAGAPRNPAWYSNLRANPEVAIESGSDVVEVLATELTGSEYDDAWNAFVSRSPGFDDYKKRVNGARHIPVLRLTRRS
ncbi:nitroreductase/quinone reductase family protein [Compostimonas suwonensis]|uniref:Deazaflavin-dependent oxidoreductase (Nitroreductase family) n=1 Tax=Compostimonas suwonensis TaxID=1048394 RepID=A0A2M9BVT4_9MICO|nr:nitroreductase/quinone reductase family protein [Compostimonas suwonensis]PJJ62024.1 deazaflavin-dependent oxidoreductase (nitroreductase family) [Compostimonas suwonensis]